MKKKYYLTIFFFTVCIIFFLKSESTRFTGIDHKIQKEKISNFKKIVEFYKRHKNYEKLVKKINKKSKNKKEQIESINLWVYQNIKKISKGQKVIDSHPWTVVERKLGVQDQFSDILSVLLVHSNIDSFFTPKINNIKYHPITFFKYNDNWSIIDPYYGIYFKNKENSFSTLNQNKKSDWIMYHFVENKVTQDNFKLIFIDERFKDFDEIKYFYRNLISNLPSNEEIKNTNIYERGGRAHIQKPIHRIIYQIRLIFLEFFYDQKILKKI